MVRQYKTVSYKCKKIKRKTCDICRIHCDSENWADGAQGYYPDEADVDLTWIELEQFDHKADTHTKVSADICPLCFTSKLVPWLESQGVVMTKNDME